MKTTVSTKGQIVLPSPLRRRFGIVAGDVLDVAASGRKILLMRRTPPMAKPRNAVSRLTGLPVVKSGAGAPIITNEMVREAMADFP